MYVNSDLAEALVEQSDAYCIDCKIVIVIIVINW